MCHSRLDDLLSITPLPTRGSTYQYDDSNGSFTGRYKPDARLVERVIESVCRTRVDCRERERERERSIVPQILSVRRIHHNSIGGVAYVPGAD